MNLNERRYFERIIRRVQHWFPAQGHVLDVGCREGHDALLLQEHLRCRITGVDIESHDQAWKENANDGLDFVKASAEALPFEDARFDAVWVKDALHHMEDPQRALLELQRVCKPGAPVVVIEANRFNPVLYVHMTLMEGHEHFSRRRLRRMLNAADPNYAYFMMESRCIPLHSLWLLRMFEMAEDALEAVKLFNPWLTYQIASVRGKGKP